LYFPGHPRKARPLLEWAMQGYDRLIREGSSSTGPASGPERYLRGRAACSFLIGAGCFAISGGTEAVGWIERAIADYEELTRRFPGDVDLWLELAQCHSWMCECLYFTVDNSPARQRHFFRRAEVIFERLARENPTLTSVRKIWASHLCINFDRSSFSGDRKAQLKNLKLGVQLYRELVASDPGIPRNTAGLAQGLAFYGFALWQAGRRSEAMPLLKESLELFETKDFADLSYGDGFGISGRMHVASRLAIAMSFSGQASEGLGVVGRSLPVGERIITRVDSRFDRYALAQNLALHSYLAFGAGKSAEASRSVERAAALLEPLDLSPEMTWIVGAIHMLWYLQGRPSAPDRPAEPPGRPEHAAQAIALVRRAAERGFVDLNLTVGFFGPVLGHLPEYQRLMMDLPFPADPFLPLPDPQDTGPLPPAAGANP
jgi:tetratricopeptide (TPR) repeat protein